MELTLCCKRLSGIDNAGREVVGQNSDVDLWTYGEQGPAGRGPVRSEPAPVPNVVEFARSRLGFEPDAIQEALLRSGVSRGVVNCTRQWGKSKVAAGMAV